MLYLGMLYIDKNICLPFTEASVTYNKQMKCKWSYIIVIPSNHKMFLETMQWQG